MGWTADGTHPTDLGYLAIAAWNAARLPSQFRALPLATVGANDPTNLVTNGLFSASSGGLGTSWTKYGSGTTTITAVTAGQGFGNWQDIGADAGGTQVEQWVTTVVGNVYELSFRLKKDATPGFRVRNISGDFLGDYKGAGTAITEAGGALVVNRFTAVSTSSQLLFGAKGASGTCSIAQVTCRDLTALGVL